MNKQNNVKVVSKTSAKKMYIPLVILLAVLFITNIVLVSTAFFSDTAKGSSVVTFGTISTEAYILENSQRVTKINFDSNDLIAGQVINKELHVNVTGSDNCYVRITGDFRIAFDGSNYVSANDMVSFSIDTTSATGWKLLDGKYYYTSVLNGVDSGSASQLTIPIKFTVSNSFGNNNADGTSVYKNKPYHVVIAIESCQAEGVDMGTGNSFDHTKWVSN